MALMEISGLSVQYRLEKGVVQAVEDVSFILEKGEIVGIVGESGCGKTTIAKPSCAFFPTMVGSTKDTSTSKGWIWPRSVKAR